MEKTLILLGALLLIGAGCLSNTKQTASEEEIVYEKGDWYLSFDLPSGWIMTTQYKMGAEDPALDDISTDLKDIVLQSTEKSVFTSAGIISEEEQVRVDEGKVVTDDFAYIRVLKLDSRRIVPSEAEDLGDGFYKVKLCDDGGECQLGGSYNYDYYFVSGDTKYQFLIILEGQSIEVAEKVILSAQPVTN